MLQDLGELVDMAFIDSVLYLSAKDEIALLDLRCMMGEPEENPIKILEAGSTNEEFNFHFSGLDLQRMPATTLVQAQDPW